MIDISNSWLIDWFLKTSSKLFNYLVPVCLTDWLSGKSDGACVIPYLGRGSGIYFLKALMFSLVYGEKEKIFNEILNDQFMVDKLLILNCSKSFHPTRNKCPFTRYRFHFISD